MTLSLNNEAIEAAAKEIFLTPAEAAHVLKASEAAINALTLAGEVPRIKKGGWYVLPAERLIDWHCKGSPWRRAALTRSIDRLVAKRESAKQQLEQKAREQSIVYFVQMAHAKHVKIGVAINLKQRLETLQCANPEPLKVLATAPGGRQQEERLHRHLAEWRLTGEWFLWNEHTRQAVAMARAGSTCSEIAYHFRHLADA